MKTQPAPTAHFMNNFHNVTGVFYSSINRYNTKAFADEQMYRLRRQVMVLGDNNEYWVASAKDAKKLITAGYEAA